MRPTYATFYSEVPVSATPSEASATYSGAQNDGDQHPLTSPYYGYLRSAEDPFFGVSPSSESGPVMTQDIMPSDGYERAALPDYTPDPYVFLQQPDISPLPNTTPVDFSTLCSLLSPPSFASQPVLGQPIQGLGYGSVHSCGVATQVMNRHWASRPQSLGYPSGVNAYLSVDGTSYAWPPTPVPMPMPFVPHFGTGPPTGTVSQTTARPSTDSRAPSAFMYVVDSASDSSSLLPVNLPSVEPSGPWPFGEDDNTLTILCPLRDFQGTPCGVMYRHSKDTDIKQHLIEHHSMTREQLRSKVATFCPDFFCICKSPFCTFHQQNNGGEHRAHIEDVVRHIVNRHLPRVDHRCPVDWCTSTSVHYRSFRRHLKSKHPELL